MLKNLGIFKDKIDDSTKCVFEVDKGQIIEMTLLFNREDTDVICVPTHYFCNLGCKMCHLTNNSLNKISKKIEYENFIFALSLTLCKQDKNNILNETGYKSYNLMTGKRRTNKKKLLISFMGVGEPTLNLELIEKVSDNISNIKRFLGYNEVGLALATMMPNKNLENAIKIINKKNIPLKIHFSLHSPFDNKRKELIPSTSLTIKESLDILKQYENVIKENKTIMENYSKCHRSNDLVEIHYTLIKGINDNHSDLNEICKLLSEYKFTIKFIKFNPKDDMYISEKEKIWIKTIKEKCNVRVKSYYPPGKNIGASCGEFTKHYYHEEIETKEQKEEFLNWKKEYEIFD